MLKVQDGQMSFNDTDYLCSRLIPEDSFYHKFREVVLPLIKDEHFESMYTPDNGRPAIPPSLLAMATILQFYRNLSDREMERACMYDIEVKYALGLHIDERPFDHSSLHDFRSRLLEHGKEKEVFDKILNKLVENGLIKRNEIQRIDATHIIADVAIPTVITLVKKSVYEILKTLKRHHKDVYSEVASEINMTEYTRESVNISDAGKLDYDKRRRRLVAVVKDAQTVLKYVRGKKGDPILERRVAMLRRAINEQIDFDNNGEPYEKEIKDKPGGMLITPIDEDARYGAKSKTKKFIGYKANINEETKNKFITNITAIPGNQREGDTMAGMIREQAKHGIIPEKIIGDAAYGDGIYRKELKEQGVTVVAPLRKKNTKTRAVFSKSMFYHDKGKETLTCPEGVATKAHWYDRQKDIRTYHFPMTVCSACKSRKLCTNARERRRTVGISPSQEELWEAEKYNETESYRKNMKLRPLIEGKLSELTRYHGLRRARYRGLKKVNLQCYFTAVAVNIKRWIKIILERIQAPPLLNVDLAPV